MVFLSLGTTSACAENTVTHRGTAQASGNYLRMRGEYGYPNNTKYARVELPPHARRILRTLVLFRGGFGTTSACAENTAFRDREEFSQGNYLRMRGEYPK